jgi:predicted nucleotidyltransferase
MDMAYITADDEALAELCRRHHIRKLSLFGSVARGEQDPDSDVDVLAEFDPRHTPGFFALAEMEDELTELLGRKADLTTPGFFSGSLRDRVLAECEVWYARS